MGSETTIKEEERWMSEIQRKRKFELKVKIEPQIESWLDKNQLFRLRFENVNEEVLKRAVERNRDDFDVDDMISNLSDMVLRDDIKYYLKNVEKIDSWLEKNGLTEQDFKLKIMEELLGKRHESKEFVLDPNRILSILSDNLRGEILEILYSSLDRLKKVRLFQNMDDSKLKEISKKLQHQRYTKSTTIISEEGLLEKILFIVDGVASIRKKYCHTIWELSAGKFYGEELLCSLDNLPKATESVKATTVVEALFIKADDLKTVLHNVNLPKSNEITTSYEVNLLPMLKKVPKLKAKDEEVLKKISGVLKKRAILKGCKLLK